MGSSVRAFGCVLLALVLAGCTTVAERPAAPRDPAMLSTVGSGFVRDTNNSPADQLAATAVTDIQAFWKQEYPKLFGAPWRPVHEFRSVDSTNKNSPLPPCTNSLAEIQGNALYCGGADAVTWDRGTMIPLLQEKFGATSVLAVLAHEMGHAVQQRSGVRAGTSAYPTIVTEAMADCYSGATVRWLADGHGAHLRPGKPALDKALQALVTFRDPVGRSAQVKQAHGDAFDRVSAFTDGYTKGAGLCKGITAQDRTFTQQQFIDLDDATSDGNLPYGELISKFTPDIVAWLRARDAGFTPPAQRDVPTACGKQGPAGYCGPELQIAPQLQTLHTRIGDWATGTLLSSRYGLALRAEQHQPIRGQAASAGALCIAGAYTKTLLARRSGFGLSPGDLDESVQLLLDDDYASRDADGSPIGSGFDRVLAFRTGIAGSPC